MKPHTRALTPVTSTGSTLEILESRIAPATLSAPGTFSYTDGDGDVVKVNVSGTFGTVDFLNDLGEDVALSGGDVASVVISKAGKNFAITVAASEVVGDGIVTLGNISGASDARLPIIKGVFTVPFADDSVRYELGGFRGDGFSIDGGLSIIGSLTGAAAEGSGLDLTNLPLGTTVYFSDGIAADATASVSKKVAGTIKIGGPLEGTLTLGSVPGELLLSDVQGTVAIQKEFSGRILAGTVPGLIEIQGDVSLTGRIGSSEDMNLRIGGVLKGSVQVAGNFALDVGKNLLGAEILVGGTLTVDVGGSIVKSRINAQEQLLSNTGVRNSISKSSLVGGTGLELTVGQSVTASRLSSGLDDMLLEVGGALTKSEILGGDDMELGVGGSISGSRVLPDGELVANVQRDVRRTQIGSQSSSATVNVGGNVMGSELIAGEIASLVVTGDVLSLDGIVGGNAFIEVTGTLNNAEFSVGEEFEVTVGKDLRNSVLLSANTLTVEVQQNLQRSALASFDNSASVTVGGSIKNAQVDSGETVNVDAGSIESGTQLRAAADVSVNAAASIKGIIIASGDVIASTTGAFSATVRAGQNLSLTADSVKLAGSLGSLGGGPSELANLPSGSGIGNYRGLRIGGDFALSVAKNFIVPAGVIVGGNVTDFHVGNDFTGAVRVAGDFAPGETTDTVTVIGGKTSASATIDVGGTVGSATSSPKLIFGGAFLGRFYAGGQLVTDLEFGADASRLRFDGGVGPALLGDNVVNIIVNGTLTSLNSASLFNRTDAQSGTFVDGAGTVTGLLSATVAALKITPESFTV